MIGQPLWTLRLLRRSRVDDSPSNCRLLPFRVLFSRGPAVHLKIPVIESHTFVLGQRSRVALFADFASARDWWHPCPMRIAHVSDIHVFAARGLLPWRLFNKRIVGCGNLLFKRLREFPSDVPFTLMDDINRVAPEHLIVSGDLSNLAVDEEFDKARAVLDGCALTPDAISVVPGNHDWYTYDKTSGDRFAARFGPFMRSDESFVHEDPFPYVRIRGARSATGVEQRVPIVARAGHGNARRCAVAAARHAARIADAR